MNGDVRLDCINTHDSTLSSSKVSTVGIVKIYNSTLGAWVPICLGTESYSGFDKGAAEAVCHQLGYVSAEDVGQNLYFGSPQSVK